MIPIQNIYYMLAYAFQALREKEYAFCATEKFDNTADLLSAILVRGVSSQIKRGLHKVYLPRTDVLNCPRGKFDVNESIRQQTTIRRKLVCTFDEFTENSYHNQILKTTMQTLLFSNAQEKRKNELRGLLRYFSAVESLPLYGIRWDVPYNRSNRTYRMLIEICRLVMEGLLQTTKDGTVKLRQFLDEQRMCRLYEKFVLEYYRAEYNCLRPSSKEIPWALESGEDLLLPRMKTDITLQSNENRYLIIDTKYYGHTTQVQFGTHSIHSQNLYQIFAYVTNFAAKGHDVSGMLLYARTDEGIQPNQKYTIAGNCICVQTLNLNCDFSEIRRQLNEIAEQFMTMGILY